MKKIYLFFLMLLCLYEASAQNTCATAVAIPAIPFNSGALTTCGSGDDYGVGTLFNTSYGGGEDYVFSYTVTAAPQTINLALTGTQTYTIASVHTACPPTNANSIGAAVTGSSTTGNGNVTFTANGTYYIIIDTWPTPNCGTFTLNLTPGIAPPVNDICSGAITVPVNTSCSFTNYNTAGATDNNETGDCTTGEERSVWFKFVATQTNATVTVDGGVGFDAVIAALNNCGATARPTGGTCTDATADDGVETLNLTGLTIGNTYYIQVHDYQGDNTAAATFDICITAASCAAPTTVATNTVTSTTANVTWGGGAGTYILEYGLTGFTPGTGATAGAGGTVINPTTTPQALSALTPSTGYQVYVRRDCTSTGSGFSANSTVAAFTTLSPPPANDLCGGAVVIPAAGPFPYLTGATSNTAATMAGDPTSNACQTNINRGLWYSFTPSVTGEYTVSTVSDLAPLSTITDNVLVIYTAASACTAPYTEVACNDDFDAADDIYQGQITTVLNAGTTYYIMVYGYSSNTGNAQVYVSAPVTCIPPTAVSVGNIGAGSAEVSFTGTGSYILEYGLAGFTPGTGATAGTGGTVVNPAVSVQTISGLTNSTAYDVYVRKDCGVDGFSANTEVETFTTLAPQLISVASGNWNSAATWAGGVIPTCTDNVTISSGNIVTVNSISNVSQNINIQSTASLVVSSGEIIVGCTNKNRSLVNNGTLQVTGGSLVVNGSISMPDGSNLLQSGGTIVIDGNDGGTLATSVASGTPIFAIGSSAAPYATGNTDLTGGTLIIVDPHADDEVSFIYYGAPDKNITTGAGHIFQLGDGISTDAGGNSAGFEINQWELYSGFKPNLVVNTGAPASRKVVSTYSPAVFQNLTVESGEFAVTGTTSRTHVEKNLTVNTGGTFTNAGTLLMSAGTFFYEAPSTYQVTESASTSAQVIAGAGTIRNAATSSTADLANIIINNSNAAGVTLARPLSVSAGFTLTLGNLNTSVVNLLTVGVSATTRGTITRTAGMVVGPIRKWFGAITQTTVLPVGTGTSYKPASIEYTTAPTTGGTLTASFSSSAPNFPNAVPLTEGALIVNRASIQGSWFVEAANGLAGGNYTATFTGNDAGDVIDYTKTVLIKRPAAGGDWALDGVHVTTTGSNTAPVVSRTGMAGFSEFAIGGESLVALPITIEYLRGTKQGGKNVLDWKVSCYNSPSVTLSLERSADGRKYNPISTTTETAARCLQPFNYRDMAPLAGINYYRLKSADVDGKVSYSNVVALLNKDKGFEIVNLAPNPVMDEATLNVTSAEKTIIEIVVSDLNGKQISKQRISLIAGNNLVPLSLRNVAAGTYQVTGLTADGQLRSLRFVKQ